MKTRETLEEFKSIAENLVSTLREEITDLRSKWAPAEQEASNRFEELKSTFKDSLKSLDKEIMNWKGSSHEELDALKTKIDELHVQLSLGRAEGIEAFEEQKKKISQSWNLLKIRLEKSPEYNRLSHKIKQEFLDWRIKMDMLKIQFSLGKMESAERWKNISKEIGKEAAHLGKVVEAGAGIAGEKLDQFEEELKKIVDKFKVK